MIQSNYNNTASEPPSDAVLKQQAVKRAQVKKRMESYVSPSEGERKSQRNGNGVRIAPGGELRASELTYTVGSSTPTALNGPIKI